MDASKVFLRRLAGVSDPRKKAQDHRQDLHRGLRQGSQADQGRRFLAQGTLYPDVIESVSVHGPSAVIKSHHNVGGLPKKMKLKLVEPLRMLFKDEVRQPGPGDGHLREILGAHPFPGPGLAIRVLGAVTPERLETLRDADLIMREELRGAGWYDKVWQAFVVSPASVRSVGVMGDERTYENTVVVRSVDSRDGMTADWSRLPYDLLQKISSRIVSEVKGHQPRRLRHHSQTAGDDRMGMMRPNAPAPTRSVPRPQLLRRGKVRDVYDLGERFLDRRHRPPLRLRRRPPHADPGQGPRS